jgi:aquaporin Z
MPMSRRAAAELIGTFWLVLGGCGTAVLAGAAVGVLGIALAFGLTVVTMAYAIGHVSGCHLNPAVTLGMVGAKRFGGKDALVYIVAQIVGAIVAIGVLYLIVMGRSGIDMADQTFAANGWGQEAAGHVRGMPYYGLVSALVVELVLTFMFVVVILGATDKLATAGMAGLAIGLALTLIHLVSIPVTNTSVNPARSIGPAVFAGVAALKQLWLFVVVPGVGGFLGGVVYRGLFGGGSDEARESKAKKSKK